MAKAPKSTKSKVKATGVTLPDLTIKAKAQSKFVFDGDAFNAIIAGIETTAKTFVKDLDYALRCAALHHLHHGQTGPINRLYNATKHLTQKNSVAVWLQKNTATVYSKEVDGFIHSEVKMAAAEKDFDAAVKSIETSEPYYALVKLDKPFKGYDLANQLKALIAQAEKMVKAAEEGTMERKGEVIELSDEQIDAIDVPADLLDSLRSLTQRSSGKSGRATTITLN